MKKLVYLLLASLVAPSALWAQNDNPHVPRVVVVGADQVINCTSNPVQVGVKVINWSEGFTYLWSTGDADSMITVKPQQTRSYEVTITNGFINFQTTRSIEVKVLNAPVFAEDETILIDKKTCPGREIELSIDPFGGYAPYTYAWSEGGKINNPVVSPTENTSYTVTVTDKCGSTAEALVNVEFEAHDPLVAPDKAIVKFTCKGEEVELTPDLNGVSGGVGYGYTFSFDDWATSNQPQQVVAENKMVVVAKITDACQIQEVPFEIELEREPLELKTPDDIAVCSGDEAKIASLTDGYYFWDGAIMHAEYSTVVKKQKHFELQYIDACGDVQKVQKLVNINKVDADFNYQVNDFERTIELIADNDVETEWFLNGDPVGNESTIEIPLEESNINEITLKTTSREGCSATTTRTVVLKDGIEAPTAISPNGDGINDFWSIHIDEQLLTFNVKIFDRWGQLLFESNDQYFEWDASDVTRHQPLNTFAYVLKGLTAEGRVIEKRGTITTLSSK